MNKVEQFRILKEIFSLKELKKQALADIADESTRITKLEDQKLERVSLVQELKESKLKLKNQQGDLELKLDKDSSMLEKKSNQINTLTTQAQIQKMQLEISSLKASIEKREEEIFSVMEGVEEIDDNDAEAKEFLQGIEETISEITQEVNIYNKKKEQEVDNFKIRFLSLKDQLSSEFLDVFRRLNQKDFFKSTFTRINESSCEFCGLSIARPVLARIDTNHDIVTCTGCGRLILPHLV
jgi:predicted  nucleic acid-binding Zn-ribbon protein